MWFEDRGRGLVSPDPQRILRGAERVTGREGQRPFYPSTILKGNSPVAASRRKAEISLASYGPAGPTDGAPPRPQTRVRAPLIPRAGVLALNRRATSSKAAEHPFCEGPEGDRAATRMSQEVRGVAPHKLRFHVAAAQ